MLSLETLQRNMVEVVTPEEVSAVGDRDLKAYIGFEPSGIPHIATGLMWPRKLNDLVEMGVDVTVLLADWHAKINDKLGGDLSKIRASGNLIRECMLAVGLSSRVKFIWAQDLVSDTEYWAKLLDVAKHLGLPRIRRALPIMGRSEDEADKDFSKYIYPIMQVTDIMFMDLDIALGGMDQRHAHMLQRDVAEKMNARKVIAVHGPLLGSLKGQGRMDTFQKMSKSDPDSAVLMSDTTDDLRRKIRASFCPAGLVDGNPVMDIFRHVIFPYSGADIEIERPPSKGGVIAFHDYRQLEYEYSRGNIHPADLKDAAVRYLDLLISPARHLFRQERIISSSE
ncbi:MAG TPA: tyrosine--tRNA ligase [Thermoplasmataceae archaeon]|nr:tyrosine--tRNA ligase [Thermoplasmatales archaeon AK]HLH85694.1 tyrosine--tRNA ligase [Thermoplasmataceae archaeon]